eukprot:IDg15629t1
MIPVDSHVTAVMIVSNCTFKRSTASVHAWSCQARDSSSLETGVMLAEMGAACAIQLWIDSRKNAKSPMDFKSANAQLYASDAHTGTLAYRLWVF